jgi:hypothetical protein
MVTLQRATGDYQVKDSPAVIDFKFFAPKIHRAMKFSQVLPLITDKILEFYLHPIAGVAFVLFALGRDRRKAWKKRLLHLLKN